MGRKQNGRQAEGFPLFGYAAAGFSLNSSFCWHGPLLEKNCAVRNVSVPNKVAAGAKVLQTPCCASCVLLSCARIFSLIAFATFIFLVLHEGLWWVLVS